MKPSQKTQDAWWEEPWCLPPKPGKFRIACHIARTASLLCFTKPLPPPSRPLPSQQIRRLHDDEQRSDSEPPCPPGHAGLLVPLASCGTNLGPAHRPGPTMHPIINGWSRLVTLDTLGMTLVYNRSSVPARSLTFQSGRPGL